MLGKTEFFKQSDFSRTLGNEARMGAFYTDLSHCRRMANLLTFPEEEEVCVLEPSIGDGKAVLAVTEKAKKRKLFGVELNTDTFESLQKEGSIDYLLNADFLDGVEISNSVFSLCFANPPYGVMQDTGERYEKKFVEKLTRYMAPGGLLVLVVPYYVLTEEKFLKQLFSRYNPEATYRFDDDVYQDYQQVVVFARKRNSHGYLKTWLERYMETIASVEMLQYLPECPVEDSLIKVNPSSESKVELFTTRVFNPEIAQGALGKSQLYERLEDYQVPVYAALEIGRPPVPLSTSQAYLTAVSGGGQGRVGSPENHDVHLQRGVVKVVVDKAVRKEPNGNSTLVESSHSMISLNVLENDGTVTVLS